LVWFDLSRSVLVLDLDLVFGLVFFTLVACMAYMQA
jgi:hypothetical protein